MKSNFELRKALVGLGISSNMQAYHYILETINILKKQQIHTNITFIYDLLAKKYNTSKCSVERTIRYAIIKSCKEKDILKKIYGHTPENSVFLHDLYFNFDVIKKTIEENLKNDR